LASLSKLERFNASSNQLTDVGAMRALGNLKQLNLSHNRLMALPCSIGESTALQELDVSNNSLQACS
jgi:Leucine-rich repeat (LRR) protein